MSTETNTTLVISAISASLRAAQELNQLLQRAQSQNRDVSDEEIEWLRQSNDAASQAIIARLRAS